MVKALYLVATVVVIVVVVATLWYGLSQFPQTTKPTPTASPTPSSSPIVPTGTPTTTSTTTPTPKPSTNPTAPPYSSPTPTQTSQPTTTLQPTLSPTQTPNPTPTPTPTQTTATFNFDTATPTLTPYQPTPFDQTNNNLAAHFSSPTDTPTHPAFSIQTTTSLASIAGVINSQNFSGNFLWPSTINHDSLTITFSGNITKISMNFKTAELNDPGPGGTGSPIRISAYTNSTTNPIGSPITTRGVESNDLYPEGTLTLNMPGQPFNLVVIDLTLPTGATGFIIDNITVQTG